MSVAFVADMFVSATNAAASTDKRADANKLASKLAKEEAEAEKERAKDEPEGSAPAAQAPSPPGRHAQARSPTPLGKAPVPMKSRSSLMPLLNPSASKAKSIGRGLGGSSKKVAAANPQNPPQPDAGTSSDSPPTVGKREWGVARDRIQAMAEEEKRVSAGANRSGPSSKQSMQLGSKVAAPTPEQLNLTTLRHSLDQLSQFATVHPAALPRMLILEAVLQARLEHKDDAIAMMRAALGKARSQGMPYEEGLAMRELGNMLQDRDMIQSAHDIFRRIGAFMDAGEAVELLSTVGPPRDPNRHPARSPPRPDHAPPA